MWSSSAGNKSRRKAVSSSTSKSSSTCLCPQTHLTRRSMEEIWKGIDLSILHHHPPAAAADDDDDDEAAGNHHAFPGLNLQNLSYLPNSLKEPPKKRDDFRKPPNSGRCGSAAVFQPAPAAVLSSDRMRSDPQSQNHADGGPDPSFLSSLNSPFDALSPSTDPFPSFPKKRASENDDNSGNCRHKRMIKNRESAARSRARKQAYATGLEGEVTRLLEENARLRRQVEKYRLAAAAQIPKKQTLHRTLTAPF